MAAGALSCNHSAFAVELAQCCTLVDSFSTPVFMPHGNCDTDISARKDSVLLRLSSNP